jgi:hypothetical protein
MADLFSLFNFKGIRLGTCGALTRSNTACQNYAMANGRCQLHGGKSLAGEASPRFKHGRYSKYTIALKEDT